MADSSVRAARTGQSKAEVIMRITVVTSVELGWDCVVAVYSGEVSQEWLEKEYPNDRGYVLHDKHLRTKENSECD